MYENNLLYHFFQLSQFMLLFLISKVINEYKKWILFKGKDEIFFWIFEGLDRK